MDCGLVNSVGTPLGWGLEQVGKKEEKVEGKRSRSLLQATALYGSIDQHGAGTVPGSLGRSAWALGPLGLVQKRSRLASFEILFLLPLGYGYSAHMCWIRHVRFRTLIRNYVQGRNASQALRQNRPDSKGGHSFSESHQAPLGTKGIL